MNQYQIESAARQVHGYWIKGPAPGQSRQSYFEACKSELLDNLLADIERVKQLSFEQYSAQRL